MKHEIRIMYDDKTGDVSMEFSQKNFRKEDLLAVLRSAPIVAEQAYASNKLPVRKPRKTELTEGTVVVAKYGHNDVLDKPFEFLYEFGYYTKYGCVVYQKGERNMQDSCAFKMNQIRVATQDDMNEFAWGK